MKKYIKKGRIKIIKKNPKGLDELDIHWNLMFNELLKFKKSNGHCNVPQQKKDNPLIPELRKLGSWVATQRRFNNIGLLFNHRKLKLIEIGFDFNPYDTRWESFFKQLLEYKEIHGHCNVPQNKKQHDPLARWVNKQRYKRNILPEDKKQRLLNIGFVFEAKHVWWEEHFNDLVEYKKKFGNCNVSEWSDEYYLLGKWVSRMRTCKLNHNRTWLSVEQEKRLEDLGIVWQPVMDKWESQYLDLKNFYEIYGHSIVNSTFKGFNGLSGWVMRQRRNRTKLSKEQIEKLNNLDFIWDNNEAISKYLALKKKNKLLNKFIHFIKSV